MGRRGDPLLDARGFSALLQRLGAGPDPPGTEGSPSPWHARQCIGSGNVSQLGTTGRLRSSVRVLGAGPGTEGRDQGKVRLEHQ